MAVPEWFAGNDYTISVVWQGFSIDITGDSEKTVTSITLTVINEDTADKVYADDLYVGVGVALDVEELIEEILEDVTYVTKLDHISVLPSSVQHHLLVDPYLHGDKGTVKTKAADTVSDYLGVKLAAGANVTITEIDGTSGKALSIAATGGASECPALSWKTDGVANEITGATNGAVGKGYIANNISQVVLTLPALAAVGDMIGIAGKGAGGWKLQCNAGQTIHHGAWNTIAAGCVNSAYFKDVAVLLCITVNTDFSIVWTNGNLEMEVS